MEILKIKNTIRIKFFLLLLTFLTVHSEAVELINNLGGPNGYGQIAMSQVDDGSSGNIDISSTFPAGINFFGQVFTSILVNTNGNVSFNTPAYAYTPVPFPSSTQPMIAPFWGDVDTRGILPAGSPAFSNNVFYSSAIGGSFIVTWYNVGYYFAETNKLNSFQLVLTNRADTGAGNIDVEFRYNRLEWTTGDASGGVNGLGGTPAQVGFDAGNRIDFYAHPDSRTENILQLVNTSNVGIPGVWRFEFRNGKVNEPPRNTLKNIVAKLFIPASGVSVNTTSFATSPYSNTVIDDKRVIEWRYDTMKATQVEDLSFDITLNHPVPGEQRKVVYKMTLDYIDVNNKSVHTELPEQVVNVLMSQFETTIGVDKNNYLADDNVKFTTLIHNSGAASGDATILIKIVDLNGVTVATLPAQTISALSAQGSISINTNWNTSSTLVGTYNALVKVVDNKNAYESSAQVTFTISTSGDSGSNASLFSIRSSTDKSIYRPSDLVKIESYIKNETSNAIAPNSILKIQVIAPNGVVISETSESLPNIAPKGYEQKFNAVNLVNAQDGQYSVVAKLVDTLGTTILISGAQFTVKHELYQDLRGVTTVQTQQIEKGKTEQCDFITSNTLSTNVSGLVITRSIINVDTQLVIESQSDTVNVSANGSIKKSIVTSTMNYAIGNYACVLQAVTDGIAHTLSSSLFSVIQPKIILNAGIKIGAKGRLLLLVDSTAPATEEAYLRQLLANSGWSFTIVNNATAFKTELIQGGYSSYALLSENVTLDQTTQNLLKTQVGLGDGLLVAGSTDRRHQILEDALGIKARANQAYAQGVGLQQSLISEPWEKSFDKSARVLNFISSGATVVGDYRNQLTGADTNKPLGALGSASNFNAFVFEGFTSPSSTVEGRLAVGGNLNVQNFSVGDKLNPTPLRDVVVVGGNATFTSGRIYYGNLIAGGSVSGVGSPVLNGMAAGASVKGNVTLPIDFNGEREYLTDLSSAIATLPPRGSVTMQWGGMTLKGDCANKLQVFNVSGADLANANSFAVSCIPADATVILNVSGESAAIKSMSLKPLEAFKDKVLFNFPQAKTLQLSSIGVEGSVLAPLATITDPSGNINGQLIAKSWIVTGNKSRMSISYRTFIGDLSAAINPSTKNAVALYQYQSGKTVFVGFDLLAQALALQNKITSSDTNNFSGLLMGAINFIQPDMANTRAGKTLPILIDVENAGAQTVVGQAKLVLSNNLRLVIADGFASSADPASWTYDFNLSPASHLNKTLYVQMSPNIGDISNIKLLLLTGTGQNVVVQAEKNIPLRSQ